MVLLSDQVLYWDFDVFECDVGCTGRPDALAVHFARAHATEGALDQKNTDTVHAGSTSANSSCEVIAPDTVCDPLLLAVDDVVLPIL